MKKFLSSLFLLPFAVFAQAEAAPQSNMMSTLMMIGVAILFFYVILWRPEQKRRKAAEAMRNSMKKGDRVTAMGIVGTIDQIKEHTVILKLIEGAKIEMLKAAVSEIGTPAEAGAPTETCSKA